MRKLIVYLAVGGCICTSSLAGEWEDLVAALPDMTSEPITNGFYFWEGEYIPPPYVVTRRGLEISINGHHRAPFATCPFRESRGERVEYLPPVPTNITEQSSLIGKATEDYCMAVCAYYSGQGLKGWNLVSNVAAAVSLLPNARNVRVDTASSVRYDSLDGENHYSLGFESEVEKDSREQLSWSYRHGGLDARGRKEFEYIVSSFQEDDALFWARTGEWGLSLSYAREEFSYLLPLIDEGAQDEEIRTKNKNRYGGEILDPRRLDLLLNHRDSLMSEEFRRRLFGEYWQTYGVKPETEEERIERLYRGVTYEERTAESFSNRLESLEYNTKLQYGAETNKWPEADIESVDRFRREYAKHVAERDAAWAALSESDRAIIRARLDKEKADAEAEKQRKLRVEAEAEIARLYTKIFSRIKDDFSSDFSVERIEEIAHETAQEEYVFSALVAYYSMKGVFPSDLSVLISYVYQGDLLLFDGARYTVDQWGRSYRYTRFMDRQLPSARLTSAGPDGKFDTEDDITTTRKSWAANLR